MLRPSLVSIAISRGLLHYSVDIEALPRGLCFGGICEQVSDEYDLVLNAWLAVFEVSFFDGVEGFNSLKRRFGGS